MKDVDDLISKEAPATLRNLVLGNPALVGTTITLDVLASGRIDGYFKDRVNLQSAARDSKITPQQLILADALKAKGLLEIRLNPDFITAPDASDQRLASASRSSGRPI